MRAILQLSDINVLVYPERVEIKGTIPTQVLERITKDEPVTAPIINSPSPSEGEGEETLERGFASLKRPAFGVGDFSLY